MRPTRAIGDVPLASGRSTLSYPIDPRYAFHPYLPVRLGFRKLMRLVNPHLSQLLDKSDPFTLMSARNRTTLYREARRVLKRGVAGDFVEIGVHRGGSAAVLAGLLKNEPGRNLHLFDRWGDLPEPVAKDGFRRDDYAKSAIVEKLATLESQPPLDAVRRVVEGLVAFPADRLRYYQGWYDATLQQYEGGAVAFASLDCDYYESTKLALEFVEKHASPGATIVLDDFRSWPGVGTAVEEWRGSTRRRSDLRRLNLGTAILTIAE